MGSTGLLSVSSNCGGAWQGSVAETGWVPKLCGSSRHEPADLVSHRPARRIGRDDFDLLRAVDPLDLAPRPVGSAPVPRWTHGTPRMWCPPGPGAAAPPAARSPPHPTVQGDGESEDPSRGRRPGGSCWRWRRLSSMDPLSPQTPLPCPADPHGVEELVWALA
mgnify:CR=1 FL=1